MCLKILITFDIARLKAITIAFYQDFVIINPKLADKFLFQKDLENKIWRLEAILTKQVIVK